MLTFGSLFAGIGGIDLGLERAGLRCCWQVEINDYAQRVLAKHWPNVPRFRDVRCVGAGELSPVDVIAGGFPCQDISIAGRGMGLAGERSGLWREFGRIVRELRPRYVLVENVAALLHRGLDVVLGDLAALGYDAEWHCIPAAAVGAPHIRDRVFVVAYAERDRWQQGAEIFRAGQPLAAAGREALADAAVARSGRLAARQQGAQAQAHHADRRGQDVPDANRLGRDRRPSLLPAPIARRLPDPEREHAWRVEPDVGRVAHGIPARVDRLSGLGNAVVPQVAELVGGWIAAHAATT